MVWGLGRALPVTGGNGEIIAGQSVRSGDTMWRQWEIVKLAAEKLSSPCAIPRLTQS